MAETSKNKIYYNNDENSVADVLADMKKMAESTDKAIENSKYDDTQIKKDISNMKTEITAKDNVQDNKILQLQNEKAELEKELKEAQEDFYQNSIRGQASGEYIHVEDSSNCRAKIGISGNSEQETREGYNLLNANLPYTTSSSGNTIKWLGKENIPKIEVNKYYYLHGKFSDGTIFSGAHATFVITDSRGQILNKTFGSSFQNTVDISNATNCYIYTDSTYVNKTVTEVAIYEGKENKAYEQHGAMPSPDYPSPIKTVGSNVNLFDKNTTIDGKYIGSDGSIQTQSNVMYSDYIAIEANKKYYISGRTNWASIGIYDASKTFLKRIATTQANGVLNVTDSNCKYIRVNASIIDKDTLKIEKGNVETSYSSYNQGCVKVTKCNKNILKNIATSGTLNGVTRTVNEDGSVTISGTSTGWANLTVGTIQGDGNSYILSGSPSNSEIFLTVNNTKEGDIAQSKNGSDAIFLPLKGSTYSVIVCIPSRKTFNNEVVKPLIRTVNDEDNTYIKHQEQSYIMPVQQEMLEGDTFDWDNEEEVHIFGKKVLTGNENWEAIGTNTSGKYRFQTKVDDIAFNADGDTYLEGICDSYKVGTPNTTYLCQESIATVQYYLIIYNEKVNDTVENFKKGLSNKNVTIYYKLATPTKLAFTDEQKAVAKELNNARTYKNVTNITTDSIAILDLDYAKDLETLLTSKESEV